MAYVRFLVTTKLFDKVVVHYLVTGHTKFSPDRMFGWASNVIKKLDLFSAADVVDGINNQQNQSYSAILCTRKMIKDWEPYIKSNFKKIVGVNQCHLVEVLRDDENVNTRSKHSSADKQWNNIDHQKKKNNKPFKLKEIDVCFISNSIKNTLSSTLRFISVEKQRDRLNFFLSNISTR